MSGFFNIDNPLFTVLSKIADLLVLSIIYLLLCIPIITIGPATTALYYTVVKVIRRDRGYLFREFFKSFRLNFKKGAIVGVVITIIQLILAFDLYYAWSMLEVDSKKGSILLGVFLALFAFTIIFTMYVFPLLSRFEISYGQMIKSSIFMSIRHILYTILMLLVVIASVILVILSNFMLIVIMPALTIFINSLMMEKMLKKYMLDSQGRPEETGVEEWYLE